MIPKEIVEKVRSKADIVDIISRFVDMQRKGNSYTSRCPFLDHEDSNPSFSVSQSKQIYRCFGCGKSGNVFTFLMEYQRLSFPEAVRFVANEVGIKIEYEKSNELVDYLYRLFEDAAQHYQENLKDESAADYFRERGLPDSVVKDFRLGFAHGFSRVAEKKYTEWVLKESGLFYYEGLRLVDIFEGRYVFPLIDINDRVVGFGGKSLNVDPVYRNSCSSRIYSKSEFLYGLLRARQSIVSEKSVIVVEGYFDVLSLAGVGIENVVGLCGAEMTNAQAKLLSRFCKEVCLFFDGDDAGRDAACKSFAVLYSNGFDVDVFVCPEGEDPDSLIKKGSFKSITRHSWFDLYLKNWDRKDDLILFVRTVADRIEDSDRRRLFFERCAGEIDVSVTLLYQKKLSRSRPLVFSKIIEENEDVLMLLSGLLKDKSGFDDPFVEQFIFDDKLDESLKKVLTVIKEFDGDESALFDGLDQDGSKVMSMVLLMSKSNPGIAYSISLMKKMLLNEEMANILKEIKEKEKKNEDCSELTAKIDTLVGEVYR